MKKLKKFDFPPPGGNVSRYPWDEILSGEIVALTKGEDFTCKIVTMTAAIRRVARQRKLTVRISQNAKEGRLVVQALRD